MKDTYYFSHDFHARCDPKIIRLLKDYTWNGYGLYWGLIEMLYENANALRMDCECIAYELRSDADTINNIISNYDLFENDGTIFWSNSVQNRLDKRKEKSVKASQSANKRWGDANALRPECEGNAIKERKGKEIKGKEILLIGKKYEFNDIVNLPLNYITSIQEQMFTLQKKRLEEQKIISLWEAFRLEKLTGDKFYNSDKEVFKHFVNWIKTQKFENGIDKKGLSYESDQRIAASIEYANRYRESNK